MFKQLPLSVWLLVLSYALMSAGGSLVVFIASLIGSDLAPSHDQATLPIALMIVGVAASALPLGQLQSRFGRKPIFLFFALLAVTAAALSCFALYLQHFILYCLATFFLGFAMASAHQYRFAVIELVGHQHAAMTTSILLFGGLLSAYIGPEIALLGQSLFSTDFMGSYALLAGTFLVCFSLLVFIKPQSAHLTSHHIAPSDHSGLALIARSPILLLSLVTAVSGFAVMSFIMTATPLTMHEHVGHSLTDTKFVIQSHIAAMYLPSLVSGFLITRLGFRWVINLGVVAFLLCVITALIDTQVIHFWWALVLLGIGWNFLFIASTASLPLGHSHEDRFKAQSTNDFILFSCQATAALSSGWFLYHWQWTGIMWVALALLVSFIVFLVFTKGFKALDHSKC